MAHPVIRAVSASKYTTSATTQTVTVPATAVVGDLLFIVMMCRSAATTPAGWTLVGSQGPEATVSQYLKVYSKTCVSGDIGANVTLTQATAGRLGGNVVAVRMPSTTAVISQVTGVAANPGVTLQALASFTAASDGVAILCGTSTNAATAGATTINVSSGLALLSTASLTDNRLGIAAQEVASGGAVSGTMEFVSTSGSFLGLSFLIADNADVETTQVKASQVVAEVLQTPVPPAARVSQVVAEILQSPTPPEIRLTRVTLSVLRSVKLRSQNSVTLYHGPS